MASSDVRWRLRCDTCGAGGAIGRDPDGRSGWCERCQLEIRVPGSEIPRACPQCGSAPSLESPRFLEALGQLQHLVAVLAAWRGDPAPLRAILPERPRFLTDLEPPAPEPGDDAETRAALDRLASGEWPGARAALAPVAARHPRSARAWSALAIVHERLRDPGTAEALWTRVLELEADETVGADAPAATGVRNPRAHLARGVLRARRGEFERAREDFAHAGDSREARWNRAALILLEAVATTPGLPAAEALEAARAEAGPASEYWSDPTVGRLLWSLLVERSLARARRDAPACPDERVMRAAEQELEHATFWDRALVLHGYSALGMRREAGASAAELAGTLARSLAGEPLLGARGAEPIRTSIEAAVAALSAGDPGAAQAALEPLLSRPDLATYGVPCARCGGVLRADAVEEDEPRE